MLPATPTTTMNQLEEIQKVMLTHEQLDITTHHALHAGVYVRSLFLKKDTVIMGAAIKIPTVITVQGNVRVTIGEDVVTLEGFGHLPAEANRKQMFYAIEDTWLSMSFATDARTVEEAENTFTDDAELLLSRTKGSINVVNGEVQQ